MKTYRSLTHIVGAVALTCMTIIPVAVVAQDNNVVFAGVDAKEGSTYLYVGAIHAFNGLGNDGFALKVFVGGGEFDYDTKASGTYPGGNVDGDSRAVDLMIGYRAYKGDYQLGIYAGINYQNVDQDLIPCTWSCAGTDADVVGSETGFKVGFEATRATGQGTYMDVRGNYSTAFDTHWARGRVGWNVGSTVVGPEVAHMGNEDYDQARIGVFVMFGNVNASIGYADTDGNGGDSAYGALGVSTTF